MKVSLVLTTYNNKEYLPLTLISIIEQDYPDIEIVIKDGESTDGTIEIIKEFASKYSNIKWTSSKDSGIYDAMNQGIQMTTGDVIACFNDRFADNHAISKCINALSEICPKSGKAYDAVHSDLVYVDCERVVRKWKMGQGSIYRGWMPGHPTLFVRREIYDKYGLYITDYRIAADYEFMVRVFKNGDVTLNYIPETLIKMFYGGTSSASLKSYMNSFEEGVKALKENNVHGSVIISIIRTIRVLMQFRN